MVPRAFFAASALTLCVAIAGCGSSSDSPTLAPGENDAASISPGGGPAAAGSSFLLPGMPEGEIATPTEIKESGDAASVILGGRIDAGQADPFQPGELAFMVSQLPDEGHGEEDPEHADNCPFCKRKLENAPRAIVQFKGADGQVIKGDARQFFSLEKGDVVFVTGIAQYNPAVNTVMVDATGVFRKPAH